jgi:hypothetical protein
VDIFGVAAAASILSPTVSPRMTAKSNKSRIVATVQLRTADPLAGKQILADRFGRWKRDVDRAP